MQGYDSRNFTKLKVKSRCVMSLQGQTARREHKVSVGSRESVVQGFGDSEEVSTTKYRQRMRGIQWIAR